MSYLDDRVLDFGLTILDTEVNRLDICSQEPTNYTEATSTYSLGNSTLVSIGSPLNKVPSGRRVVVASLPSGLVTSSGTANYWALVDTTNSRLLAAGLLDSPAAVTSGNGFSLDEFEIGVPDPANFYLRPDGNSLYLRPDGVSRYVRPVNEFAPVISSVPTISGDTGLGDTLTFTPASVTGTPTPTRTWQVYRNAAPVGSPQSGNTYVIVEADLGTDITVQQIETNSEGTDTATSAATSIPSASPDLLLDTYTGAAAAYSLRKLRSAYTGAAIRVRRSSDNAEQDIGFTAAGVLDQSALTTFVGAGDGFVVTWYDQSGNGRNATQATTTVQPRIVASGIVELQFGLPSIYNASSQGLTYSGPKAGFNFLHDGTKWLAAFAGNISNDNGIIFGTNYSRTSVWSRIGAQLYSSDLFGMTVTNATERIAQSSGAAFTGSKLMIFVADPGNVSPASRINGWLNGDGMALTTSSVTNTPDIGDSYGDFNVGCRFSNGLNAAIGHFSELIFWSTDQSANRTAIEANINAHYGIY